MDIKDLQTRLNNLATIIQKGRILINNVPLMGLEISQLFNDCAVLGDAIKELEKSQKEIENLKIIIKESEKQPQI